VEARLQSGEVRFVTGPRFRGARLTVATPEAQIEVSGTTLAVIRDSVSTCVCVLSGTVRIGPAEGAMETVPAGRRRALFRDGRTPHEMTLSPMESMKLGVLRERCLPALERGAP
jgi:ferric-dicitrate binding protein FerR (iron transport regulator)